ncbi:MAG: NUDIX hydrolase [Gemmatimonadota bacterium]|nr:NUDIX hydrolase [Gemmatimonadota bacterium]
MSRDKSKPTHVLAAGGVVWRGTRTSPRIAVLHRARYEDRDGGQGDWTLPKGKLEPGERLVEAARREVLEETGCSATVTGPACFSEYSVDGVPKVTVFFPMAFEGEEGTPDATEVRSVHWLSPEDALRRLTYDGERAVLRQLLPSTKGGEA